MAVPVGNHGRLRPGVQILARRFREDLCLDAGEVIEAAEGVVMPIDPVQGAPPRHGRRRGASIPGL